MTPRSIPPAPTTPEEIRHEITWLMDHPIWTYPHKTGGGAIMGVDLPPVVMLGGWADCVEINIVYVDPATERIEEDESRNTALRVWLEAGPWHDESLEDSTSPKGPPRWSASYDPRLDCGGPSIEVALLELARLVRFYYGDDRKNPRE